MVWWGVWSSHPTSTTTCGCGDSALFLWFFAWPAHALAHGLDPFYSTAMSHPGGVNLLANTSELALGMVLAPVTWAFGPVASMNVALTLAPALSALAMFVLVRRWVAWAPAAFAAGLLYGFSPLVLVSLSDAHLMLGWAVVPPLVVACVDELLTGRRPPVAVGLVLGLLLVVQFFVGTEVLLLLGIVAASSPPSCSSATGWPPSRATCGPWRGGWPSGWAPPPPSPRLLLAWPTWFAAGRTGPHVGSGVAHPRPRHRGDHRCTPILLAHPGVGRVHPVHPPGRRLPGPHPLGPVRRDRDGGGGRRRAGRVARATGGCGSSGP